MGGEPRTEAGRSLLDLLTGLRTKISGPHRGAAYHDRIAIRAIESEAAAAPDPQAAVSAEKLAVAIGAVIGSKGHHARLHGASCDMCMEEARNIISALAASAKEGSDG